MTEEVQVSPQFFGWVAGLGAGVEIVTPADLSGVDMGARLWAARRFASPFEKILIPDFAFEK